MLDFLLPIPTPTNPLLIWLLLILGQYLLTSLIVFALAKIPEGVKEALPHVITEGWAFLVSALMLFIGWKLLGSWLLKLITYYWELALN